MKLFSNLSASLVAKGEELAKARKERDDANQRAAEIQQETEAIRNHLTTVKDQFNTEVKELTESIAAGNLDIADIDSQLAVLQESRRLLSNKISEDSNRKAAIEAKLLLLSEGKPSEILNLLLKVS